MTSSLDIQAVADLLGVKRRTVYKWRQRGLLPRPSATIARSPVWTRRVILAWAKRTGRLEPKDVIR